MKKQNKQVKKGRKVLFIVACLLAVAYLLLLIAGGGMRVTEIEVGAVSEVKLPPVDSSDHTKNK